MCCLTRDSSLFPFPARLDFHLYDFPLLIFLVVGGFFGVHDFPEFFSYSDVSRKTAHPIIWCFFFSLFDCVLLYKLIAPAFFRWFPPFIVSVAASFSLMGIIAIALAFFSGWPTVGQMPSFLLISSSGVAVLLLAAQSWIKPRLYTLLVTVGTARTSLRREALSLVHRRAAIDEIFHADAVFDVSNGSIYRGRDEIERIAGVTKADHPEFRYQPISAPEEVADGGRAGRPRA